MQAHLACAAPWPAPTQSLGRPFIAGVLLLEVNRELPLRVQPLSTSARGKIFSSSRHTGGPPAGTEACTPCSSLASFCGDAHKPAPLEPFPFSRGPRHAAATSMWTWCHAWRARPRPDMCAVFRMLARDIWHVVRPRGAPASLCRQVRTLYDIVMPTQVLWAVWARARPIFWPGWAQEAMGSRLDERAPAEQARWRHGRRLSSQI